MMRQDLIVMHAFYWFDTILDVVKTSIDANIIGIHDHPL